MPAAVSDPSDVNGGSPHGERDPRSTSRAGNERLRPQSSEAKKACKANVDNPACWARRRPTSWAITRRPRSRTLGLREGFLAPDHMFEPVASFAAGPSFHGLGLVRHVLQPGTVELHQPASSVPTPRRRCRGPWTRPSTPAPPTSPTPGPTSPGSSTTSTSPWAYYVQTGDQPDCDNDSAVTCPPVAQSYLTPGIWNPLPVFEDVQKDHQIRNIQPLDNYFAEAKKGILPAVSWVTPSQADSEHPPAGVHQGQAYVTAVINAVMQSPDWDRWASSCMGRLGRLLRPRAAAARRPERLRPARPAPGDLPLGQDRATSTARPSRATPT